eukprot:UC4_evm2s161
MFLGLFELTTFIVYDAQLMKNEWIISTNTLSLIKILNSKVTVIRLYIFHAYVERGEVAARHEACSCAIGCHGLIVFAFAGE